MFVKDLSSFSLECDCHIAGVNEDFCEPAGGKCKCKENIDGKKCDKCVDGFYPFPDCNQGMILG